MTKVQEVETQALLPISQAPYMPGVAYDEMVAANGEVRPHYRPLQARMSTLTSGELGDRQHARKGIEPGRDGDHAPDPGGLGARHHLIEFGREIREIQMAMAVDQHQAAGSTT